MFVSTERQAHLYLYMHVVLPLSYTGSCGKAQVGDHQTSRNSLAVCLSINNENNRILHVSETLRTELTHTHTHTFDHALESPQPLSSQYKTTDN